MRLKLLQLNIFKGKFLDNIVDLVKKENFDILQFQEVTGGKKSNGGINLYPEKMNLPSGNINNKTLGAFLFEDIKKIFHLNGDLVITNRIKSDPSSYEGNATFYNNDIQCTEKNIIWLQDFKEIDEDYTEWETIGRAALSLKLMYKGKQFYVINTHNAWGPNSLDEDYKIEQAQKLVQYIQTLKLPYIVTGDFNVIPQTKTISIMNSIGRNLISENNIYNTLNSNVHPAKRLFPPGIAVDYIFVEQNIKVIDFRVISNIDLSDHFGFILEFEI
ncbi:MAG: hypothetical protein Q7R95_04095 [bacterium]|nr:hypothetical protein [bacterium]